jgi:hypothetical protein
MEAGRALSRWLAPPASFVSPLASLPARYAGPSIESVRPRRVVERSFATYDDTVPADGRPISSVWGICRLRGRHRRGDRRRLLFRPMMSYGNPSDMERLATRRLKRSAFRRYAILLLIAGTVALNLVYLGRAFDWSRTTVEILECVWGGMVSLVGLPTALLGATSETRRREPPTRGVSTG